MKKKKKTKYLNYQRKWYIIRIKDEIRLSWAIDCTYLLRTHSSLSLLLPLLSYLYLLVLFYFYFSSLISNIYPFLCQEYGLLVSILS